MNEQPKKKRGFALMSPEKLKEIAAKGGRIAHQSGHAHQFAPGEEARDAARRGVALRERKKAAG